MRALRALGGFLIIGGVVGPWVAGCGSDGGVTDEDAGAVDSGTTTVDAAKAPTCSDKAKNGAETDVDCGGTCGTKCSDGSGCAVTADCATGECNAGKCRAVTCSDGVMNGAETDVDCGGTCDECADGKSCGVGADCASGVCDPGSKKCLAPTCTDAVANGSETDVDCGGSCTAKCALGKKCGADLDCVTSACSTSCVAKPVLTRLGPGCGGIAGGAKVTFTGTGFIGAAGWSARFGGTTAAGTFTSATSVFANTPAHAAGKVDVDILGMPGGTMSLAQSFLYLDPAAVAPTFDAGTSHGYSPSYALAVGNVGGSAALDFIEDHSATHVDVMINQFPSFVGVNGGGAYSTGIRRMILADLNGDGRPDAIQTVGNSLIVALGNTGSSFDAQTSSAASTAPEGLVAVDLNGDGKLDVVVIHNAADSVGVFLGAGNGTFAARVDYAAPRGTRIATGDFDGDGKKDIVASSSATNAVTVLRGNGDGTLAAGVAVALGAPSAGLAVADVDLDGLSDIVAAHGSNVALLVSKGDGTFAPAVNTAIPGATATPSVIVTADLDSNGTPDVALVNQSQNRVEVWLNTCTGTLTNSVTFPMPTPYDLAAADFNGDGKMDLLFSGAAVPVLRLRN